MLATNRRYDRAKQRYTCICNRGGMAISVISDWIERYCCADINNAQYYALSNLADINLTGLKQLDSVRQGD
ncbi:MAG: hypothetical protein HC773_25495 [Scytonema sp. CRU_2_7]|nr:hypothetical protein [Scytonema sp. CRU_2_7]